MCASLAASVRTRLEVRRVFVGWLPFIAVVSSLSLGFPALGRAQEQAPPLCPPSVLRWTEACALAASSPIRAEGCPDHRALLEMGEGSSEHLRVEIAPGSKGFRKVRGISLSPIGSFADWNAAPAEVRRVFDQVVRCAEADARIDGALLEVPSAPARDKPSESRGITASPQAAWLWSLLFVFLAIALKSIVANRLRSRAFFMVFAAAFGVRMFSAHYPANWYSDLWGPRDAVSEVFLRRGGGYAGFFQWLDAWKTIAPIHIFAFSALCSSFAVALLTDLALLDGRKHRQRWGIVLALISGFLLVFDPRTRYLGASDAAHDVAVFSFALTLWFHCDTVLLDEPKSLRTMLNGAVILLSTLLMGMTRPELLPGAAVVPLLAILYASPKLKRHVLPTVCAILGAAIVVVAWADKPLGVVLEPVTHERLAGWFRGSTFGLLWLPWLLVVMEAIRRRSPAPMLLIVAYYVAAAPRIPTGYAFGTYYGFIGETIAAIRYDAISHVILLLSVAYGFAALEEMLGHVRKPAVRTGARVIAIGSAMLFCVQWSGFTTDGAHRFPAVPASFQREYVFLERVLPLLPEHSTVVTVWNDHFPSRSMDPDVSMAWPAPLLSYLRRDIKFVAIDPRTSTLVPEGAYVFTGAMCSLDVNALGVFVPAEDVEYMRQFATLCRHVVAETVPVVNVPDERYEVADRRFGRNSLLLSLRKRGQGD